MNKSKPNQQKNPAQGGKKKIHFDLVDLETAWLQAYDAWLRLDDLHKQLYPMPRKPEILQPRIVVKRDL